MLADVMKAAAEKNEPQKQKKGRRAAKQDYKFAMKLPKPFDTHACSAV